MIETKDYDGAIGEIRSDPEDKPNIPVAINNFGEPVVRLPH